MPALHSGNFVLDGNPVMGPDGIVFQEKPVVGLRLDGIPQKQGYNAMEWRYATVPGDEMQALQGAWLSTRGQGLSVTFINKLGEVESGFYYMQQPIIGKRRTYFYDGVVIRFTATYRTGIAENTPLQAGTSASYDRFMSDEAYPRGISSGAAFGTLRVVLRNNLVSVVSAESFGTLRVVAVFAPLGIASSESFGNPSLILDPRYVDSVASTEAVGAPTVVYNQSITVVFIASAEMVRSPQFIYNQTIAISAIGAAEAFGTLLVRLAVLPSVIASEQAFGTVTMIRNYARSADGASISTADPVYLTNVVTNAIDGNDATGWLATPSTDVTGVVDLGSTRTLVRFRLLQSNAGHLRHFVISSSPDNATWTTRYTSGSGAPLPSVDTKTNLTLSATERYWRLQLIGPSASPLAGSAVYALELYGY